MNYRKENGKLIIDLEGRIDSLNAVRTEAMIFTLMTENEGVPVAFDAKNLRYISSAGLRILMKVRRRSDYPVEVYNVSEEIFEVFEVTGFSQLLTIMNHS